jgi:molecular chaperone DnaK (HSP70)
MLQGTSILKKTGKRPEDINKVILTGGTSQIPRVRKKIEKMFSPEIMLYDTDFHNSVSRGLALYAYYHDICLA